MNFKSVKLVNLRRGTHFRFVPDVNADIWIAGHYSCRIHLIKVVSFPSDFFISVSPSTIVYVDDNLGI